MEPRHASEPVVQEPPTDRFAHELGFTSYLELFETSTPLATVEGKAWCITRLPRGEWIVWNDRDLVVDARYTTREEAAAHTP